MRESERFPERQRWCKEREATTSAERKRVRREEEREAAVSWPLP